VTPLNDRERMHEIIRRLEEEFPDVQPFESEDAFPTLIRTILSQNTSDRNSSLAYRRLKNRYTLTPEVLAELQPGEIKPLIRCAGLHEIRSRRIVEVSKAVLELFDGNLRTVLDNPLDEARGQLLGIKGVGYKTADILLCFVGKRDVMPIDTNIFRVVNRLGFAEGRRYERVRRTLESLIPPNKIARMHLLLIQLGRDVCKPRRPLHQICPIKQCCSTFNADRGG
jgi:endonuclease-3